MSTVQQQGLLVRNLWYTPHERTLKFSKNLACRNEFSNALIVDFLAIVTLQGAWRKTFIFFLLYVCDMHNRREEIKLFNNNYI